MLVNVKDLDIYFDQLWFDNVLHKNLVSNYTVHVTRWIVWLVFVKDVHVSHTHRCNISLLKSYMCQLKLQHL